MPKRRIHVRQHMRSKPGGGKIDVVQHYRSITGKRMQPSIKRAAPHRKQQLSKKLSSAIADEKKGVAEYQRMMEYAKRSKTGDDEFSKTMESIIEDEKRHARMLGRFKGG